MSHKIPAVAGAMTLAAGALVATAAPAAAATGSLTLSLLPQYAGGVAKTVTLTCGPTGGTHPNAEAACADLEKASGNIAWIPPLTGVFCVQVYLPVIATASGTWDGRWVQYTSRTFTNQCDAVVSTGGDVFRF